MPFSKVNVGEPRLRDCRWNLSCKSHCLTPIQETPERPKYQCRRLVPSARDLRVRMEIVMIYSAPIFLRDSLNCQGEIRQPFYDGSTERFEEMYDCNRATLERYAGVILSFGISSFAIGYLSLQLTIGSAPVFDPRDILVTCAGVFAGPLGGGLVGLLAGIGRVRSARFCHTLYIGRYHDRLHSTNFHGRKELGSRCRPWTRYQLFPRRSRHDCKWVME